MTRLFHPGLLFLLLASSFALTLSANSIHAAEIFLIPEERPGIPAYARELDSPHSERVVYVFYRSLDCVPLNFNLVDFIDFDLLDPDNECPILMQGFEIWDDPDSIAPYQRAYRAGGWSARPQA